MAQLATVPDSLARYDETTRDLILAMRAERERNREFVEAHRDELFTEHPEDWLLIHSGGQVIASDHLFKLVGHREALEKVARAGALIEQRPRHLTDPETARRKMEEMLAMPQAVIRDAGPASPKARAAHEEHQRNLDFFLAHHDELYEKHPHMWLLIHSGGQVVASNDLMEIQELRDTFDDVTRSAALYETTFRRPLMITTPFFI